jgi:hypothetical protein
MELFNWIFFGPARLLGIWPYAGFAIAGLLIGAQALRSIAANESVNRQWFRKAPVFAGLLWVIFNLYELQMAAVFQANAGTNQPIRLDLMVLVPLLYVLTAFAIVQIARDKTPPITSSVDEAADKD